MMEYAYTYRNNSRELVIGKPDDVQAHITDGETIHVVSEQSLASLVENFQAQEMIVTNLSNIPIGRVIEHK